MRGEGAVIPDTADAAINEALRIIGKTIDRLEAGEGAARTGPLLSAGLQIKRIQVRPGAPARGYVPEPYRAADKDDVLWAHHPEARPEWPLRRAAWFRPVRGRGT